MQYMFKVNNKERKLIIPERHHCRRLNVFISKCLYNFERISNLALVPQLPLNIAVWVVDPKAKDKKHFVSLTS